LLEQTFVKDVGKTVRAYLHESTGPSEALLEVKRFQRFRLGEETT
jgi:translation elongation factor EF-Ts